MEKFNQMTKYIPEGEEYPNRKIIFQPEIYVYIKDFGGTDDCVVVLNFCENAVMPALHYQFNKTILL